jgi:hypothetical protein
MKKAMTATSSPSSSSYFVALCCSATKKVTIAMLSPSSSFCFATLRCSAAKKVTAAAVAFFFLLWSYAIA